MKIIRGEGQKIKFSFGEGEGSVTCFSFWEQGRAFYFIFQISDLHFISAFPCEINCLKISNTEIVCAEGVMSHAEDNNPVSLSELYFSQVANWTNMFVWRTENTWIHV